MCISRTAPVGFGLDPVDPPPRSVLCYGWEKDLSSFGGSPPHGEHSHSAVESGQPGRAKVDPRGGDCIISPLDISVARTEY